MENTKNQVIEAAISIVETSENRSFYEYELETIELFLKKYIWNGTSVIRDHAILFEGKIKNGHFCPKYPSEVLHRIFVQKGKLLNREELNSYKQKFNLIGE